MSTPIAGHVLFWWRRKLADPESLLRRLFLAGLSIRQSVEELENGAMIEERVWYLKCKICGTLHSSGIVVEDPAHGPYELPICLSGIECPSNPGKKAGCSMPRDWL